MPFHFNVVNALGKTSKIQQAWYDFQSFKMYFHFNINFWRYNIKQFFHVQKNGRIFKHIFVLVNQVQN
jgi:hypothetical protein